MIRLLALLFCVFFITPTHVFASSMTLSSSQSEIFLNDEATVNVSFAINTGDGTSYYLRGVFFKEGTSNYCGYTWNGNSWYNGPYSNNGWNQLFPVTIYQSSWSGQLKVKIDANDTGCQSSGAYNFKVQRYTGSGSSSFDPQNTLAFTVVIPTPTPTNSPTNTPAPTPTKTPTPTSIPTSTTKINTPTPVRSTTAPLEPSVEIIKGNDGEVLGTSAKKTSTPTPSEVLVKDVRGSFSLSPAVFIIGGLIVMTAGCGILLFREWKKQKSQEL